MQTKLVYSFLVLALLAGVIPAGAQGTAFTYQGRLNNGSSPANGSYDLRFSLFNVTSGGSAVAGPLTNSATGVTNGLFNVTLDFGSVFNGTSYWLEIGVRTNGIGAFTTLEPRQPVLPTPYAIFAEGASNVFGVLPSGGLSGGYSSAVNLNNVANNFNGNGSGLTGVNAQTLDGISASQFWQLVGNGGTTAGPNFVGTTDYQPLELHVNSTRAFRLEPTFTDANHSLMVNLIGGSMLNYVPSIAGSPVYGATISGGGGLYFGSYLTNVVLKDFGTIGGGGSNECAEPFATVGGGEGNLAGRFYSTVLGGLGNTASGRYSIAGGSGSVANSDYSVALGAAHANSTLATAVGNSVAGGTGSFAAGTSVANGSHSIALGISTASGDYSSASGDSTGNGTYSTALGTSEADGYASVAMGYVDYAYGDYSIANGASSEADGICATVAGGSNNIASADFSTVGGGEINNAGGMNSVVAGGMFNDAWALLCTIGGGWANKVYGPYDTISGGYHNFTSGLAGQGPIPGVPGYCTVGGGYANEATNFAAVVSGGADNWAWGYASTICGGDENFVTNSFATVAGGRDNTAGGQYSFAAGYQAKATLDGSFVWNSFPAPAPSFVDHRFHVFGANGFSVDYFSQRQDGGGTEWAGIGIIAGQTIATWTGAFLSDSGVWQNASDRNRKTAFATINPREVLAKVAAMPVQSWRYTNETDVVRHLGPTAQDFKASFGLGTDDKSIGTVDEEGVALAAIQGLNQKLEETQLAVRSKDGEIQTLKQQNDSLAARLNDLEATVKQLAAQKVYAHEEVSPDSSPKVTPSEQ